MGLGLLREVPIWIWAPIIFGFLRVAFAMGTHLGRRERERLGAENIGTGGQVTLGAMLALLGLLLAFTYSFALNRADARKVALVEETNAIGTAYQWADLAAEPARTELQTRLLDYAKTRIITPEALSDDDKLAEALARSLDALDRIWPATKAAIGEEPRGPVQAATVAAVIEVGDVSTIRIAAGSYRIPHIVMGMLLLVMFLALMLVAYRAAKHDSVSLIRSRAFALVLTALILVILDFDRPQAGFIQINEHSLLALIDAMEKDLADR